MTIESIGDLLSHAQHKNKSGDFVEFQNVYRKKICGHFNEKGEYYPLIHKMIEEILIDLFCETEHANRVLVEENGVFSWQKGE